MKKILLLLCAVLLIAAMTVIFASCGEPADTTAGTDLGANGVPEYKDGNLLIVEDGLSNYQVVYPQGADQNKTTGASFEASLGALRKAFKNYGFTDLSVKSDFIPSSQKDTFVAPEYEILVGDTNREESTLADELAFNQAVIRVVNKKVVIVGKSDMLTIQALYAFIEKYMSESGTVLTVPSDLDEIVTLDMSYSYTTEKSYMDMAMDAWNSFNEAYFSSNWVQGTGWWDAAEVLETYIDAYEATKDDDIKAKMLGYATQFIRKNGNEWRGNDFNDDIMWACIGFSRISLLTGEDMYVKIAKRNFDMVWDRAWSEDLGGGLFWKEEKDINDKSKNSCVNCPAAIAACFLAQYYEDDTYYEKAKMIMDWEFKVMFNSSNGQVYDDYKMNGKKSTWASTYNQGTFIGACTLLAEKYGDDDRYMKYAAKAADYAMNKLTTNGILDNGEGNPTADNRDLIGFKGILTRWLYRYAQATDDISILSFLQTNAETAYKNRNADGLMWTQWHKVTPDTAKDDGNHLVFGMSTAVALLFNCHQWW